jgi:hypothetical protein
MSVRPPDVPPAVYDPAGRRLRLSPRHLGAMADLARDGHPPDPEVAATLTAAGVLGEDGEVVEALRPVAAAAATARAVVRVSRLRLDSLREVQVRVGDDGVLLAPAGAPTTAGDIALAPPWALTRLLWRLTHLGPRPTPAAAPLPVDVDDLVSGVREGTGAWRATLGIGDAVLDRLEIRTGPEDPGRRLVVLDTPEGCWSVEGDDATVTLRPVTPRELLGVLAAWQRAVVGPDGDDAPADPADEGVEHHTATVGEVPVRLPVPCGWQVLPGTREVPLLARQPEATGFAANLTAAPTVPTSQDPIEVGAATAAGLEDGRLVDAWSTPLGPTAVVLHADAGHDIVAVQRTLVTERGAVAVTLSCGVAQWPGWGARLLALADGAEVAADLPRDADDVGAGGGR